MDIKSGLRFRNYNLWLILGFNNVSALSQLVGCCRDVKDSLRVKGFGIKVYG